MIILVTYTTNRIFIFGRYFTLDVNCIIGAHDQDHHFRLSLFIRKRVSVILPFFLSYIVTATKSLVYQCQTSEEATSDPGTNTYSFRHLFNCDVTQNGTDVNFSSRRKSPTAPDLAWGNEWCISYLYNLNFIFFFVFGHITGFRLW